MAKRPATVGERLHDVRARWGLTRTELAAMAGVGTATIRRTEQDETIPRRVTAIRIADALHIRVDWLLSGDSGVMLLPGHMTVEEQQRMHPRPGTEGLPGYVIIAPGGPWYRDRRGRWSVDRRS